MRAGGSSASPPSSRAAVRRALPGYALIQLCLLLLAVLAPGTARLVAWNAAGIIALLALGLGPAIAGVERPRAWRLLAAAGLLLLAGNYAVLGDTTVQVDVTLPSSVDFLVCAAYPLAAVAVLVIAMRDSPIILWARLVDTLIVLAGLSMITWTLLVVPLAGRSMPSTAVRAYAVTFALGDAFILVILGRLLYPAPRRAPAAVRLLLGGTFLMLCSDVIFSLAELGSAHYATHSALGLTQTTLWLLGFAGWGAAALSPSAAVIVRPVDPSQRIAPAPRSLLLLTLAALCPLAVVVTLAATHQRGEGSVIAVFGTVLCLLLVTRLSLTLAQADARLRAEQTLGAAADRLVAANEAGQILGTVLDSAQLLAGGAETGIAVAAAEGDEVLGVANDVPEPRAAPVPAESPEGWVGGRLAGRPHAVFGDSADPALPAALCLGVTEGAGGLGELRGPLRILASQASLALSRLGLTREISRRDGEAYFRALVEDASDAIVIVEQSGRVRYASPSAAALFRVPEPTETDLAALFGAHNAAWVLRALEAAPGRGGSATRLDWSLDRAGAGRLELEVACSDLRGNPAVRCLVLTLRDVTAQRRLERDLRHHAYHDRLTGMSNRLKFTRRVELAMATARAGLAVPAVVLLDLDNFRELNEVHGREFGDLVLITVGGRIAQEPGVIEAARLDSDSFGALVETPDGSPTGCLEAAGHLAGLVSRPFELPTGQVTVTACAGVASSRDDPRPEDVLRDARLALESAKAEGRDTRRGYDPAMLQARLEHAELHRDLQSAIAHGDMVLRYQPMVELATGLISAFEALVRWQHPQRGSITPDKFIPLAEETGLIVPLGRWVFRQAALDAAALRARPGGGHLRVAVNVSARQFSVPGLVADLDAGLAEAGLGPDALIVELTESALIRRAEEGGGGAASLDALKELGVGLAIDDFGTGYSALSYLHDLPFDALKIDKSFVDEITTSPRRMDLVRGIIDIADSLGLSVVAEGLEQPRQRELLTAAGCRYGQGFLFSPPVPIDEALELLATRGAVVSDVADASSAPDASDTSGAPADPVDPVDPGEPGGAADAGARGSREAPGGNAFTADT
ncbi:MAG TPA: EAL domain-containing protein [Actinospica sp.]|nr:EAL domain-containing protein [Actinospica sp.]